MDQINSKGLQAALSALIVLQLVMLGSLFASVTPHPPLATPLFGIAPFLAMSLAVALSAVFLASSAIGQGLSLFAALAAAISFGPQKYFDAQFALIWPAVIAGQVAIAAILVIVFKCRRTAPQ